MPPPPLPANSADCLLIIKKGGSSSTVGGGIPKNGQHGVTIPRALWVLHHRILLAIQGGEHHCLLPFTDGGSE